MSWITNTTLGEFFDRQANVMPYHKALITPMADFTFKELKDISDLLARGMIELGVNRGDKVAVLTHNIPEWVFLFLALSKIGAIMVPLNCNGQARDLRYALGKADVRGLFLIDNFNGTDYLEVLHRAVPDLCISSSGKVQSNEFPLLRYVITVGERHHHNLLNFEDVLGKGSNTKEANFCELKEQVSPHDTCVIKFTCSLTGYSRGAMLTHFGLINNALPVAKKLNLGPSDTLCLPMPFYYIFGFWVGLIVSFTTHTPVVIIPKYNALEVLTNIEQKRCTVLYGVPTLFSDLLSHPAFPQADLSSLRTGIMSADYCPPELVKKAIEEMPIPELTVAYGITEVGIIAQTGWNEARERAIHTVGQALDGIEIKVANLRDGEPLPPGEIGEICVRSPFIMKGYYNMPQETSEIIDGDGWFHTGDLGTKDNLEYYQITGRNRNIIIRGGENIYPVEVENMLLTHPDIGDVRIVGVPSRRLGEEVFAFVTARNGTSCNSQTIREYFRTKMSRHMTPRWVKTIDEFPRADDGKVNRNELRKWAIAELEIQEGDCYQILYDN